MIIARTHRRHDALSLFIKRARETVRVAISRRKVPAKEKLKTFLQPRGLLEKFRFVTMQPRDQQSDYLSSFAVTLTIEFSLTARSEIQSLKPCLTS